MGLWSWILDKLMEDGPSDSVAQTRGKGDAAFGKHPAIMPEEIIRRCVALFSFYGDLVLDPFTGSGTTLKVAQEMGRRYVGYEIMKNYKGLIEEKLKKKN